MNGSSNSKGCDLGVLNLDPGLRFTPPRLRGMPGFMGGVVYGKLPAAFCVGWVFLFYDNFKGS